jgi:two-component system chemotaxis response regulator CheY
MPGDLDGLQVCLALKADASLQHIPVVMLTAGVQELEQQAARQAGANLFMAKPFSRAKLLEVVRQFLSPESAAV